MAHIEVNTFINHMVTSISPFYKHARVLEIGSYDVNGSVRSNFNDVSEYVGVDLIPGPSVDVVTKGHLYNNDTKFDIVLSVESFEHNSDWVKTFENMIKLTNSDGILIFTCATRGRLEHGTFRTDPYSSPGTSSREHSYYMNLSIEDFTKIFSMKDLFVSSGFYINHLTKDLYFYGLKGYKKIECDAASNYFEKAAEMSIQIRKQKSFFNYLNIKLFYYILSPLYLLLSDTTYQNVTYWPYKKIRKMVASLR